MFQCISEDCVYNRRIEPHEEDALVQGLVEGLGCDVYEATEEVGGAKYNQLI